MREFAKAPAKSTRRRGICGRFKEKISPQIKAEEAPNFAVGGGTARTLEMKTTVKKSADTRKRKRDNAGSQTEKARAKYHQIHRPGTKAKKELYR